MIFLIVNSLIYSFLTDFSCSKSAELITQTYKTASYYALVIFQALLPSTAINNSNTWDKLIGEYLLTGIHPWGAKEASLKYLILVGPMT